jgi:hypothetical protein
LVQHALGQGGADAVGGAVERHCDAAGANTCLIGLQDGTITAAAAAAAALALVFVQHALG